MRPHLSLVGWLCVVALVPDVVSAATITVSTTNDVVADDGSCSLREAVIAANTDTASGGTPGECVAGSGVDEILVGAGTYDLTIGGAGDDSGATGDLDVNAGTVSITGASASSTFIDANSIDRVLDITDIAAVVNLTGVTIRNGAAFDGGGIQNDGTLVIDAVTLTANNADVDGGAITNSGTLILRNSTISNNNADGNGAGIDVNDGVVTLTNCTISGNFAGDDGGGFDQLDGVTTMSNVTIAGNTADDGDGGGISQSGGTVTIRNSIVARNTDSDGEAPDCDGDLESEGYNLIENTDECTIGGALTGNITGQNPLLGSLQNNGGTTSTRSLLSGSPAIDAGNPAAPGGGGTTCEAADQRGTARPQDGNADSAARCDMGAFELVLPPTPTPTQSPTVTDTVVGTVPPTPTTTPTATITPTPVLDPNLCYVVGEASNNLISVNKKSRLVRTVAAISGAGGIQAIALALGGRDLYAAAGDQLGTIDLATGVFTPTSSTFGTGDGIDGPITFDDITGLAFNSKSGAFYGVHHEDVDEDVLFRIDPVTGAFVPQAFELGTEDYVPISGCLDDIEDIAVDKRSGNIFAISNDDEADDELVSVEIDSGDCTSIGSLVDIYGNPVEDMGGLSFHNDGQLYGSTAESSGANADKFWKISKTTAEASLITALPAGGDDEALACPFAGCLPIAKVHHVGVVTAGSTFAYRYKWMNRCDGLPATGVVVTDTLPSSVEFLSVTTTVPVQVNGNQLTFNVGTLPKNPAGLATVYARIKPTAPVGQFIQNEVVMTDGLGRRVSSIDKFRVK